MSTHKIDLLPIPDTLSDSFSVLGAPLKTIALYEGVSALLAWDQETYMPPRGTAMRARVQGTMAGLAHEILVDDQLVNLVRDLQGKKLEGDEAVNVRETARQQERALKIPSELVVEMTQTASLAHEAWVEAREKADFSIFQPWLEKILDQKRQVADFVGYEGSMYNALLDEYEPYAKTEEIAALFTDLRTQLIPLVEGIAASGKRPDDGVLDRVFNVELQERFGRGVIADMGFDMDAGRLDVAVHPFCSGTSRPGEPCLVLNLISRLPLLTRKFANVIKNFLT